jgi:hypothetical protein
MEVEFQAPSDRESTVGKRRRNLMTLPPNFQTKMTVVYGRYGTSIPILYGWLTKLLWGGIRSRKYRYHVGGHASSPCPSIVRLVMAWSVSTPILIRMT